jgi:hypothetical protein
MQSYGLWYSGSRVILSPQVLQPVVVISAWGLISVTHCIAHRGTSVVTVLPILCVRTLSNACRVIFSGCIAVLGWHDLLFWNVLALCSLLLGFIGPGRCGSTGTVCDSVVLLGQHSGLLYFFVVYNTASLWGLALGKIVIVAASCCSSSAVALLSLEK